MPIKNLSENIILVELFDESELDAELQAVNELVGEEKIDCDVIIDFLNIEIIVSTSLSNLIILQKTLSDRGQRLLLQRVAFSAKCIFTAAGLETLFEFVKDGSDALAILQSPDK